MVKPKKILNDPQDLVEEFMQGLLIQYPNHLVKLANHPVLLDAAWQQWRKEMQQQTGTATSIPSASPQRTVTLVSGGGSGHEPSHAGWIGSGMLTAAVCGGVFASPSVSSILAAIRAVTPPADAAAAAAGGGGVLLVVKNYTGDKLNFGMAAEIANLQQHKHGDGNIFKCNVDMVIVADDCALPRTKGITGARGVAGTVLVHKIAGAAAARPTSSLEDVVRWARLAASRMGTLGIALNSVTVPGAKQTNDRLLEENTIEIGLGIHGEAGLKKSPLLTANEMAREMVTTIRNYGRLVFDESKQEEVVVPLFVSGDEVCILVNNLGGTSNFEMSILARSCVSLLESDEFSVQARRVKVGSYMTSFDMQGVSLTILNVTGQDEIVELLDAPTNAPAWPMCDVWKRDDSSCGRPSASEVPEVCVDEKTGPLLPNPPLSVHAFHEAALLKLKSATQALAEAEPILTRYDTIVGDGDCGITMKRGATEILRRLMQEGGDIPTDHPIPMFLALADAVSASMGGTSGVLLELMLRKMASTLTRTPSTIGPMELALAFQAGVDAISHLGGAQVGSRTMLDALVPAANALVTNPEDWTVAARVARVGADSTAAMKVANAGRSNYLSETTLDGTPDPGAIAVAIVFEAIAKGA